MTAPPRIALSGSLSRASRWPCGTESLLAPFDKGVLRCEAEVLVGRILTAVRPP